MEKIKIITDTAADVSREVLEKYNVLALPLLINFGEESYLDGVSITRDEVFKRIESGGVFPTTAQITPNRFEEVFTKYLDEGYKVLAILMSSSMSGTYQSACIAKKTIDSDNIIVVDSQSVCSGLGLLVIRAARLIEKGMPLDETVRDLEIIKDKIEVSLSFDSLDNLVKGGRISKAVSVVTGVLGIKLILEIKDGLMSVKDKVRGSKKAVKRILKDLESSDIREDMPVLLPSVNMEEVSEPIKAYLEEHNIEYMEAPVGATVGIHSGDKAAGIFFVKK